MRDRSGADVARQAANVVGALFQVFAGLVLAGANPGEDAVLIQPSTYAFFVWAPIFRSSLAYAAYQAMPANRGRDLFRRTGWLTAAAFFFNGVLTWSGGPIVGQVLVFGMLACLAAAFLRISRSGRGVLSPADRWLVALPVGLYCGWITAATVVGALQTLVRIGLPAGAEAEASLGCLLLLAGGLFAAALVRAARGGPSQGYLAYAAAVLWTFSRSLPTSTTPRYSPPRRRHFRRRWSRWL